MNVTEAVKTRQSVRAFLDKPVARADMLLARERGLDTCAQEAWASWYKLVAEFVSMPEELMLFCGMAVGYRDAEHPINDWRTNRGPLEEFVEWHGI